MNCSPSVRLLFEKTDYLCFSVKSLCIVKFQTDTKEMGTIMISYSALGLIQQIRPLADKSL